MSAFLPGDTFLYGSDADALHLHVIICGPTKTAASVLVVSFNSVKEWTDKTVVIQTGEHPFIVRETSVSYNQVRAIPISDLDAWEAANLNLHPNFATFLRHFPVSPALLLKIQVGAIASPRTPKGVKQEIKERLGLP